MFSIAILPEEERERSKEEDTGENTMSFCGLSTPQSMPLFSKPFHAHRPPPPLTSRFRASADVPDFLSADCKGRTGTYKWARLESRRKRPFGPRLNFSAEEAVQCQLDALMFNDQPRPDYGIEVMYRFAGFDPFERSTYFGPFFDLGQADFPPFDLSSVAWTQGKEDLEQFAGGGNQYKQRVWIRGARPEEEEIFQFTMVQRVGGSWDGYWLTESLLHDGDSFSGGVAY
ncbi:unnamed protein product [Camellia sinensis]